MLIFFLSVCFLLTGKIWTTWFTWSKWHSGKMKLTIKLTKNLARFDFIMGVIYFERRMDGI